EALRIGKPDLRTNWKSLKPLDWSALSEESRKAYEALSREPQSFEVILAKSGLPSAALTSALCELELFGRALQHPGKRYERV
ncbi:MAG TPA: hypothetical protein VEY30_03900, partial [Myxococcaceae bacterium]|nr:hypothetical protein [Myxococcaceae bacterium]